MIVDERTLTRDPLSLALASLAWPGWQSGTVHLSGSWGLRIPNGHISIYAVRRGECWVSSPTIDQPVRADAGDILLFPHGSAHTLQNDLSSETVEFHNHLDPGIQRPDGSLSNEIDREQHATRIVYGHLAKHDPQAQPINSNLSSFLHLSKSHQSSNGMTEKVLEMVEQEQFDGLPGWQAIVNQLVQLVFHQSLRSFATQNTSRNPQASTPEKSLVTDPAIGLVVGLIHSQPEKPWTVASLARWANMSRSAFSERFRDAVGKPPLNYLTELRMMKACELLSTSDLGVKQIASIVGYESPSSFTNAFKRWHGTSPASYRRRPAEAVS